MKKLAKNYIVSCLLIIVSIIYTIVVKKVDVQNIGPNNSSVGLATINNFFMNLLGSNMIIYKITEVLGILAILVALTYALVGIFELVDRKSLKKVDKEIIAVGGLYIVVIMLYIFFEKVIINYRPILIDGELEASFPSSHTMLAICVCVSSMLINKYIYKNKKVIRIENAITLFLLITIVCGRLLSGVHWFTDIVGGIIISVALLYMFSTIIKQIRLKKDSE